MSTKNLTELIKDLQGKIQVRGEKIRTKIDSLEQEAEKIKSSIADETKDHIRCELSGDDQGQEKCNKTLRKLRDQLNEVQDLISAYKSELDHKAISSEDIKKIQAAALEERKSRYEKIKELVGMEKETQTQITELQNKVKQIDVDISRARFESEINSLLGIQDLIAPCLGTQRIDHHDRMKYLAYWTEGNVDAMGGLLAKYQKTAGSEPRSQVNSRYVELDEPLYPKEESTKGTYQLIEVGSNK